MNLKKWLQPRYMIENLKKSKSLLALILFLFPLITSLVQLSSTTSGAFNVLKNNTLTVLGMFTIPILLSISFFSFVYKKKKVDFVMGMPLSRRQIFLTNTISGIAVIILMFLINVGLLYLFTFFNSNIILSSTLMFDYFLIYTLGYILVFTMTNVAMSLAGNLITQLVLTLLLLFLVPFCLMFQQQLMNANPRLVELSCQSEQCQQIIYDRCVELTGVENCKEQAASGYYYTDLNKSSSGVYTVPVESFIKTFLSGTYIKYQVSILLQTLLLIILMIIIGIFTFQRRKMEECETSFTSFHVHTLVKCLTIIPFALLIAALHLTLKESIIIILILIAYYYLYDLITQKGIQHVFKSLLYFIITLTVCFGYYYSTEAYLQSKQRKGLNYIKEELQVSDIIGFNIHFISSYDMKLAVGYPIDEVLFQGKKQINTLLQYAFQANEMNENRYSIRFSLHLKQGAEYNGILNISDEQYQNLMSSLRSAKETQNLMNITEKDILMASFQNIDYSKDKIKPILTNIKELISNSINVDENINYSDEMIDITIYKNHDMITLSLPLPIDSEIINYMIKLNNESIKTILKTEQIQHANIASEELYTIDNEKISKISNIIKEQSGVVDTNKPYIKVSLFTTNNKVYYYITNQIEMINYFSDEDKW